MSTKYEKTLLWIFGIFIILMGLVAAGRQPFGGLLLIIAGAILLPPIARRLVPSMTNKWRIPLAIFLAIVGISMSPTAQEQEVATEQNTSQPPQIVREAVAVSSRTKIPFVYDIPSLLDKNYPQLKATLGNTIDEYPLGDKMEVWFAKQGFELSVDYNPKTNDVFDFFLSTDDPSGQTNDIDRLMDIGNLTNNDPRYTVQPVKVLSNPSHYTGIKILTATEAQAAAKRATAIKAAEKHYSYATVCAQEEVKAMLKAPSTADFPWGTANVLFSPERNVFDVVSYVDAENSFGAMIRTNYVCTVADHHDTHACDAECRLQ